MGFQDVAEEDHMVTRFNPLEHSAFKGSDSAIQGGSAVESRVPGYSVETIVRQCREPHRKILLRFAQNVDDEDAISRKMFQDATT